MVIRRLFIMKIRDGVKRQILWVLMFSIGMAMGVGLLPRISLWIARLWQMNEYQPRTPLGKRLMEIRTQIVASGERLLGWEEINRSMNDDYNSRS